MLFEKIIIKKMKELNELKGMLFYRGEEERKEIIKEIKYILGDLELILEEQQIEAKSRMREFTLEELSKYDGKDGKLAYVAVNGSVYDVTGVVGFSEGQHFGIKAGTDGTNSFNQCHGKQKDILKKLRVVGVLKE
ncbi:MAG: cytochrome b5 domain-containing protein [Clostridium sp.]|uniref:cytochrome b5 domain-containing protein n=1 Tax=Clostridium sp. TaxID=1506 RepID=UPI003F33506D